MMEKSIKQQFQESSDKGNMDSPPVEDSMVYHQLSNIHRGMTDYAKAWKTLDSAGSFLLESLESALKNTAFEFLGKELCLAFQHVYSRNSGAQEGDKVGEVHQGSFSGVVQLGDNLKAIEALLLSLKSSSEAKKEPDSFEYAKPLSQCLLSYLKTQADYHHMCSVTIATLLSKLTHYYKPLEAETGFLASLKSVGLIPDSSHQSPSSPRKFGKKAFMSLFDRKTGAPERGKSAFYVDLDCPQPNAQPNLPLTSVMVPPSIHVTHDMGQSSKKSPSDSTGRLEPNNMGDRNTNQSLSVMGQQENALSNSSQTLFYGNHLGNNHGNTDHRGQHGNKTLTGAESQQDGILVKIQAEDSTQNEAVRKPASETDLDLVINLLSGIGSQTHLGVPAPPTSRSPSPGVLGDGKRSKMAAHHHSDGNLELNNHCNALWSHRSSLPTDSLVNCLEVPNGSEILRGQRSQQKYSHEYPFASSARAAPGNVSPWGSIVGKPYNWGDFPGAKKSSQTWPLNNTGGVTGFGTQSEVICHPGSWSALQDSDGASEDSLCGENPVPASSTQNHQAQQVCRDNWSRSTNENGILADGVALYLGEQHRPLSMQWSDPLVCRGVWPDSECADKKLGSHK